MEHGPLAVFVDRSDKLHLCPQDQREGKMLAVLYAGYCLAASANSCHPTLGTLHHQVEERLFADTVNQAHRLMKPAWPDASSFLWIAAPSPPESNGRVIEEIKYY
jgi:hypothetical protein